MHHNTTHGHTARRKGVSPTYTSWQSMKTRCSNPNAGNYEDYGARGITYVPQWESFDQFFTDMGERPEDCTLDRIDPEGNYTPDNCRWADYTTQERNRRNSKHYELNGIRKHIAEWAEELGITPQAVRARVKKWGIERALTTVGNTSWGGKPHEST